MFSLFQKDTTNSIHVSELDTISKDINLIDIREVYEYANGSIKNAKNIPMGQLLANPAKYLDKKERYHIICQSGMRSSRAVSALSREGYDVVNVKGGVASYLGQRKI